MLPGAEAPGLQRDTGKPPAAADAALAILAGSSMQGPVLIGSSTTHMLACRCILQASCCSGRSWFLGRLVQGLIRLPAVAAVHDHCERPRCVRAQQLLLHLHRCSFSSRAAASPCEDMQTAVEQVGSPGRAGCWLLVLQSILAGSAVLAGMRSRAWRAADSVCGLHQRRTEARSAAGSGLGGAQANKKVLMKGTEPWPCLPWLPTAAPAL